MRIIIVGCDESTLTGAAPRAADVEEEDAAGTGVDEPEAPGTGLPRRLPLPENGLYFLGGGVYFSACCWTLTSTG